MVNLFGNNDESKKRREMLSARSAPPGSRVVTFGKAVIVDKIIPGTEAARLEQQGKLKVGDEITMVSATFGEELWSARGVGKYRLEKSIAVRQGATISFV